VNITSFLTCNKKLKDRLVVRPRQNQFRIRTKRRSVDECNYGGDNSLSYNGRHGLKSISSHRGSNKSILYTPSSKRENIMSSPDWTSIKHIDPKKLFKVQSMVEDKLKNPNSATKVNLEDYFDSALAASNNPA
jgi:hypothetical protein